MAHKKAKVKYRSPIIEDMASDNDEYVLVEKKKKKQNDPRKHLKQVEKKTKKKHSKANAEREGTLHID